MMDLTSNDIDYLMGRVEVDIKKLKANIKSIGWEEGKEAQRVRITKCTDVLEKLKIIKRK